MAKKSNFIEGAFKETDELMKRFLNTVQSEYKNIPAPEEPKQPVSRQDALKKLMRGF
tara:strand:+ start:424 stop:594 length:171 start_codon:yes stop_codon:yes gene_type:complete